jgi:hypothetical protein
MQPGRSLIGLPVETFDHRSLGVITAIDGERILLQPKFQRAFWIADILVRNVTRDAVTLHVNRKVLARYRHREPGAEAGIATLLRSPVRRISGAVCALASALVASSLL